MSNKKDPRARLAELIGPDSMNFLGTGLTLREFMQLGHAEKLAASWVIQIPENASVAFVPSFGYRRSRPSQELSRIQETTMFATRLAELAIKAVIVGDRKMVEEWDFTFNSESADLRGQYAATSAFRELLLQTMLSTKEIPA